MRWLAFMLLAGLTICVQTTVAPHLEVFGVRPEFMLILVVHYALHARSSDGLIAGWILGLFMDMSSVARLGQVALLYGSVGLAVWAVREMVFCKHPLTHFTITACSCLLVQGVLWLFFNYSYDVGIALYRILFLSLLSALYTGLWAVLIQGILVRLERPLGFRQSRHDLSLYP